MPYSGHYEQNYEQFFKGAIQNAGLDPVLAAHLTGPRMIVEDIWEQTKNAFVVLADMTGKNPNVFYEIGLAHALGKPVVLLVAIRQWRRTWFQRSSRCDRKIMPSPAVTVSMKSMPMTSILLRMDASG